MDMQSYTRFEIEYTVPARDGFDRNRVDCKASFPSAENLRGFLRTAQAGMIITSAKFVRVQTKDIMGFEEIQRFRK